MTSLFRDVATLTTGDLDEISRWLGPGLFGRCQWEIMCNPVERDIRFLRVLPCGSGQLLEEV